MSITEVTAYQNKLASIVVCKCKKADCATSSSCICKKNGKLCKFKCHGGRGVNTQIMIMWHSQKKTLSYNNFAKRTLNKYILQKKRKVNHKDKMGAKDWKMRKCEDKLLTW